MQRFSKALARTPLHHWHAARGARFVEHDDWQIAASYSDVAREVAAAHSGLALVDVSAFTKISLQGDGVANLVHGLVGDGRASKPRGVAAFTAGSRVLACRLTEEHLFLLALTTNAQDLRDRLLALRQHPAMVESDVSCAYAAFGLLGDSTEVVLRHLTALDVGRSTFAAGCCAETSLAGVHALLVRPPETSLDLTLVAVAWDVGEYVWERLLEVGKHCRLEPIGLDAWTELHKSLG